MIFLFLILFASLLFLASKKDVLSGHGFVIFASAFAIILFTVTVAYTFI
jgi:hypothetical protein